MNYLFLVLLNICLSIENFDKIQEEAKSIQHNLEESFIILSNLLVKLEETNRSIRLISNKSNRVIIKLLESTDVSIYNVFNSDIEKKHKFVENQYFTTEKSVKEGGVTNRIEKVIDYYVKRQQVPDPEMHHHLLSLERKIGEVGSLIKNVYNLDWLYLVLIISAFGVVILWKNVKKAEKRHFL